MKKPQDALEGVRVAIFCPQKLRWVFYVFDTWEEARNAVNAARGKGHAAVFYDGSTVKESPVSIGCDAS
jgi:hypothetical protein